MLERAPTCLESGGRQLFRAPKQCLRSRRMLHTHFWHHGASDLALPIWWAASSVLAPAHRDADGQPVRNTAAAYPHSALLDFLYPEKTLALLRRLSVYRPDAPEPRQRLHGAGVRQFSTTRVQLRYDEAGVNDAVVEQAKEEMKFLLHNSYADIELKKLLKTREPGKQELAWQLFVATREANYFDALRGHLVEYLVQDGPPTVPSRVLQLFGEIEASRRRPSAYRAAIVAYITLRMVGPAIQLLEEVDGKPGFEALHIGAEVILGRTVFDEQWDLSLRVFRTFLRQNPALRGRGIVLHVQSGKALPQLWSEVTQLPELLAHLQSFFQHASEFQHDLNSTKEQKEALSYFAMTFVPHVMDRVLNVSKPDEDFIWDYFIKLFDDFRALRLPTSACYEYAIMRMIKLPRYQGYTNHKKIWSRLYRDYRQGCLDQADSTPGLKPSRSLIRNVIFQAGLHGGLKRVQGLVHDLRTFYPDKPLALGLLKYLLQLFAEFGQAEQVQEYFDELRQNFNGSVDTNVLTSLSYVHARRADVSETTVQFRRIHDEFGLTPDTSCWNILLLAHTRAGDLDGALECFNHCISSGLVLDRYTFGPLLELCAQRGDIEAFEALFSRAKQMGIPLDADVRARSAYVQAFLNAGDVEGAEAIAHGMLTSWQAGTLRGHPLTHTWNLLIQHYALDRDIALSRQCYRQMVDNNIPLDSWTYGSLMRALVEAKQTNAAYKLLRVTMPAKNIKVHALHYAIVITGFLREKQLPFAIDAYERMRSREVQQTESSRQASLQAIGTAAIANLNKRPPKQHIWKVEAELQKMLMASTGREIAHREPRHSRYIDAGNYGAVPQSYYGLALSIYSSQSAYGLCKNLFKKAEEAAPETENYTTPLTLITTMMQAHLNAGKHAEVARCWELARDSAAKISKTLHQAARVEPELPDLETLTDPVVRERFNDSLISPNRRHALFKATRIYVRSLLAQPDPKAVHIQEAQRTIRDLLVKGFTVDNFTWNEYVQQLAERNRLIDAFTTCEQYLMPRFPGWRMLYPAYIRNDRVGYQWMEIRHYDITRKSVLPRYKTLVLLAKAFGKVRSDERNGVGYDEATGAWMRETLEEKAPMTIRAIETMPRTSDKLQERYFHSTPF